MAANAQKVALAKQEASSAQARLQAETEEFKADKLRRGEAERKAKRLAEELGVARREAAAVQESEVRAAAKLRENEANASHALRATEAQAAAESAQSY